MAVKWVRSSTNIKTSVCGCCIVVRKKQIATGKTIYEGWVGEKLDDFGSSGEAYEACEKAHENVRCEG